VLFSGIDFGTRLAASTDFSPLDLALLLGVAALTVAALVVMVGVWQMERWARIPAIVVQVVLVALVIASLRQIPAATTPEEQAVRASDICGALFWVFLNLAYIYWFATHKRAFEPPE
jgi:hypothetical protein